MAKLGELYKITSGGTPSRTHSEYYEDGTIPWVKTGDLKDKYLFETDEKISQLGLENSSARIYLKNTVLLAMYGATIGATSILKIDAATNQACAAFSPREDTLPEYLYAFLESQKDKFIKDAVGGAQPNLSAGYLKTIEFKLPSLEQQTRITRNLSKIDELLLLRKQQLAKLDELVKARFVEMFGEPVQNPNCWKTENLLDLGYCKNGMNFHRDDCGTEIHCLGVGDFKNHSTIRDVGSLPFISLNELPTSEYLLQDGDIVFVRSNGNKELVGRCLAIYPAKIPVTYSGFCIRYRLTSNKITVSYLLRVLKADSVRKKMTGRGANIQNLNQQILAQLVVPIPPLSLQNQFAAFVERVDQQKQTIQQSLEKLELMKKALMQEYFG